MVGAGLEMGIQRKLWQPKDLCSEDICGVGQKWGLSPSLSQKVGFKFVFGFGLSERERLQMWLERCSK